MAWYEKTRSGHRARFSVIGKATPASGPFFPSRTEAKEWAIQHGHDAGDITTIAELAENWRKVKLAEKRLMPSYIAEAEKRVMDLAASRMWERLNDITMSNLNAWKIDAGGVGISKTLACLLALLRWGRRQYGLSIDAAVLRHETPKAPRKVMADVLLTDHQVSLIMERAMGLGPGVAALIHYLATYGPRPITACTRKVSDVDFTAGTILVDGKRSGQWRHALLPETVDLFAVATRGRTLDDALFLQPRRTGSRKGADRGHGWPVSSDHSAASLCEWYRHNLGRPICGKAMDGIYHLKRYAITGMLARGIDPATVAKFTGHLSLPQVLLYARGNLTTTKTALEKLSVLAPHSTHLKGVQKNT